MFQSTRPRGARLAGWGQRDFSKGVSIHAPARGATCDMIHSDMGELFQSTRPRGARPEKVEVRGRLQLFQSTRPRGARHPLFKMFVHQIMFQSTRPRGARRLYNKNASMVFCVSIHAPARGATAHEPIIVCTKPLFQSTRPRGARPVNASMTAHFCLFQSTRPRGARQGS